ncbi:NADPH2:quinone reductase [Variovorax boronicumulans]|uniref:NADPH2:quinone reductase n=1 Tax=Variovorax boronicumulans TaxID=436515 RepID=A0AAW8CY98_9BURK|nr:MULTISPECIES: quinone oxidoreductase [Variovorax]MDP9895449.1 NADPH2:quinone reductase [Variovorax boronicumulans]MDP9995367.1 NADPH2:quinone reductase [Variovorax boronicumulans]MDQ0006657.1 NADPH2:quinone reductase [Variovorax boronicumulans]MDQ0032712.1 NADPH2:quinone reductase [Variovorax boronicumulans]MDQ0055489.1 NADPH2:quinone reductase [Variovorax boronicumulans]
MRTQAIRIQAHGGPEVLEQVEVEVGDPGPGEVRIRQSAIGLNFADIYQRRGSHGPHAVTAFPVVLGAQGAGTIDAIGPEVEAGLHVGQSVAYFHPGAYQAVRNIPAHRVVPLPAGVSEEVAGATLLRGLTAEYLLRRLYPVAPGEAVLVHAAAGGMGVILSQWARALGATVIGTVGSEAKMAIARAHGCHHVIDYRREDFVARTLECTGGQGVSVVYDAVGKDVFLPSLDCLKPLGMAINYGTASGDVEAFDLQRLHAKSLSVSRPTLRTFIATAADLRRGAAALFDAVLGGQVTLEVGHRYPLAEARRAHEELESRATTGAAVLIP